MKRRLAQTLSVVCTVAVLANVAGCAPVSGAVQGSDPCARAMALQHIDARWLAEQRPYEEIFRTMVESRSLQTRRNVEAITTCYKPGDEIWSWRRSVWMPADEHEYVAAEETGYALVRNGATLGGVAITQQQTGGRVR